MTCIANLTKVLMPEVVSNAAWLAMQDEQANAAELTSDCECVASI